MKMNVPQDEADKCVREVRKRQMGYWFENMEKMDIQAERRNTAKAKAELEKTKQELEKSRKDAVEKEIMTIVTICRKYGASKEQAAHEVIEHCHLELKEAEEKAALYWEESL